ncbi:hypothetical protein F5884DRAFT_856135 [Xylogone sp. PMI_703]|nr:hypothetical protein F5884DRAFT_856135 [Xylogone sp. PMI_703]
MAFQFLEMASNDDQQREKLLNSIDSESEYDDAPNIQKEVGISRRRKIRRLLPWALHTIILLSYGTFMLIKSRHVSKPRSWPSIYDGLELPEHVYKTTFHSNYEGRPTAEVDRAWHEMLNVGIVSITERERDRLPYETAANIYRNNEYVVEMNVFHQLHCLHGLREQLWNPRSISWRNNEPVGWWEFHMNHCIEHLRQTLICHADITPQRFRWSEEDYAYSLDQEQQFMCRDWDQIWNWAKSRNTTGDYPMNLKGLEKNGKQSDAGESWLKDNAGSRN